MQETLGSIHSTEGGKKSYCMILFLEPSRKGKKKLQHGDEVTGHKRRET